MVGVTVIVAAAVAIVVVSFIAGFVLAKWGSKWLNKPRSSPQTSGKQQDSDLQSITVVATSSSQHIALTSKVSSMPTINGSAVWEQHGMPNTNNTYQQQPRAPLPYTPSRKFSLPPSADNSPRLYHSPTRTPYSRHAGMSPDVVLMRAASQVLDEYESRSALHRFISPDAVDALGNYSPQEGGGPMGTPHPSTTITMTPMAKKSFRHPGTLLGPSLPAKGEVHVDEVALMERIGGGAYGSVYKGDWHGAPVAVKCIVTNTDDDDSLGRAVREVVLSKKLTHPNVVQCFSWTVLAQLEDDEHRGQSPASSLGDEVEQDMESLEEFGGNGGGQGQGCGARGGEGVLGGRIRSQHHLQPRPAQRDLGATFSTLRRLERSALEVLTHKGGAVQPHPIERRNSIPIRAMWVPEQEGGKAPGSAAEQAGGGTNNHNSWPGSTGQLADSTNNDKKNGDDGSGEVSLEYLQRLAAEIAAQQGDEESEGGSRVPSLKLDAAMSTFSEAGSSVMLGRTITKEAGPSTSASRSHSRNPSYADGASTSTAGPARTISTAISLGKHTLPLQDLEFGLVLYRVWEQQQAAAGGALGDEAGPSTGHTQTYDTNSNGGSGIPAVSPQQVGPSRQHTPEPDMALPSTVAVAATPPAESLQEVEEEDSFHNSKTKGSDGVYRSSAKRRRMSLDSPPAPKSASQECSPVSEATSFNSEEGFGSPVKTKAGGVQSVFALEGLILDGSQALLVVVMEFCDLGSLHRALQRKAFLPSDKWPFHRTYRALLRTAAEVAKGMQYIHEHHVVHGDLKPGNVLLKTHKADRRGYIAKVSDFGLSHLLPHEGAHATANTTGQAITTVAYTAPEVYATNAPGKPADVFAFGIMMWEMYYCKAPYDGLIEAQVCVGVSEGTLRPEFDQDCPAPYRALVEKCWHQDPSQRPSFPVIWQELAQIELDFRAQWHKQNSTKRQQEN